MREAEREPSRARLAMLLATLAVLAVAGLTAWGVIAGRRQRWVTAAAQNSHDVSELERMTYTRPVLRGAAIDGNATAALHAAVAHDIAPHHPKTDPIEPHRAAIAAIRAATQRRDVDLTPILPGSAEGRWWNGGAGPLRVFALGRMMVAHAATVPSPDCFELVFDAIRAMYDLGPNASMMPYLYPPALLEDGAPIVLACARRSTPRDIARAANEARNLAEHKPDFGRGVAGDALGVCADLATQGSRAPFIAWSSEQPFDSGDAYSAWQLECAHPLEWVTASHDYRSLHALASAREARYRSSKNPVIALLTTSRTTAIERDAAVSVTLRALAIWLGVLAGQGTFGTMSREPALQDPFGSAPLLHEGDGEALRRIWSVGVDGRDDHGSGDDVVVGAPAS